MKMQELLVTEYDQTPIATGKLKHINVQTIK